MAGTSISLPTELELELEKIMWREHKSKSEVVRDALIPYIEQKKMETGKARRRV